MLFTTNYQSRFQKRAHRLLLHSGEEFESNISGNSQYSVVILHALSCNARNKRRA